MAKTRLVRNVPKNCAIMKRHQGKLCQRASAIPRTIPMWPVRSTTTVAVMVAVTVLTCDATAQCDDWRSVPTSMSADVYAMIEYHGELIAGVGDTIARLTDEGWGP